MECQDCRYYKNEGNICIRFPAYVDRQADDTCGEWQPPVAVLKPPTAEELARRIAEETRPMTVDELRKQAERDYVPPESQRSAMDEEMRKEAQELHEIPVVVKNEKPIDS
jgi:Fe-S-cluster containining protein